MRRSALEIGDQPPIVPAEGVAAAVGLDLADLPAGVGSDRQVDAHFLVAGVFEDVDPPLGQVSCNFGPPEVVDVADLVKPGLDFVTVLALAGEAPPVAQWSWPLIPGAQDGAVRQTVRAGANGKTS